MENQESIEVRRTRMRILTFLRNNVGFDEFELMDLFAAMLNDTAENVEREFGAMMKEGLITVEDGAESPLTAAGFELADDYQYKADFFMREMSEEIDEDDAQEEAFYFMSFIPFRMKKAKEKYKRRMNISRLKEELKYRTHVSGREIERTIADGDYPLQWSILADWLDDTDSSFISNYVLRPKCVIHARNGSAYIRFYLNRHRTKYYRSEKNKKSKLKKVRYYVYKNFKDTDVKGNCFDIPVTAFGFINNWAVAEPELFLVGSLSVSFVYEKDGGTGFTEDGQIILYF